MSGEILAKIIVEMVHPFTATTAHRLSAINSFGAFLSRWHRAPIIRAGGTALTQLRTVRRGGSDRHHSSEFEEEKETKRTEERKKDEHRHESSSSTSSSSHFGGRFSSTDPEQIRREFNAEFNRFLRNSFFSKDKKTGENFEQKTKAFIDDFNKRLSEFEVEKVNFKPNLGNLFMGAVGLTVLGVFIAYRMFTSDGILPEHRAVVAQQHSAISFDEFVQHYLAAGEVRFIYFYPSKGIAVASLQPGAVIRGQPFYGSAVLIRLDPYRASGANFLRGIEDAQHRLGIDPREHVPTAIQFPSVLPAFLQLLSWVILAVVFIKYSRAVLSQSLFKVKRKEGRGETKNE